MTVVDIMCRFALLSCAIVCGAIMPAAARDLRPGIMGTDDRVPVDVAAKPWAAVGQVNVARYRRRMSCTGTLIAPDRVLTAAHCLIDPVSNERFPLKSIHFLTGVFGSRWKEHAQPACVLLPTSRDVTPPAERRRPARGRPLAWFRNDVAVLVLKKALTAPPLAIVETSAAGDIGHLSHAAYAGDRRHRLTAHLGCALQGLSPDGLWQTDCDTHKAGSGGPVLVERGGAFRLAGVMVGIAEKRFTVAVPAALWRDLAQRTACPATSR